MKKIGLLVMLLVSSIGFSQNWKSSLEEAKIEKEKLLANQEQNKLDQKATEDALILQNQALESAKKKIKD